MSKFRYVCLEGLDKAVMKMSELGDVCGDTYGRVLGWAETNTVDAVEVVRCKDCRHRYVDGKNVRYNVCELNHNKVQSDEWFCADGERREEKMVRNENYG